MSDLKLIEQEVLLVILRQHPNAYGVSIHDQILEKTGKDYSIGTIYSALERLESKGYVASHYGEKTGSRGGRRKLHYQVTAPGKLALTESRQSIQALERGLRWGGAPA